MLRVAEQGSWKAASEERQTDSDSCKAYVPIILSRTTRQVQLKGLQEQCLVWTADQCKFCSPSIHCHHNFNEESVKGGALRERHSLHHVASGHCTSISLVCNLNCLRRPSPKLQANDRHMPAEHVWSFAISLRHISKACTLQDIALVPYVQP